MASQNPCEGCEYFFGEYVLNRCCNYIFVVGQRRPCPPGEGCTCWTPRDSKSRQRRQRKKNRETVPDRQVFERACPECGTVFATTRLNRIYCSYTCQDKARRRRRRDRQQEEKER